MTVQKEKITRLVHRCVNAINEQLPEESRLNNSPDARILGGPAGLDSLGFITFVGLIEEECASELGLTLSLADAAEQTETSGPFETIGDLVNLIEKLTAHGKPS